MPSDMRDESRSELCTSQHPNHKVLGQVHGLPLFWQAWCSICALSSAKPNPYMKSDYFEAAMRWAKAEYAEKAQRWANRGKKKIKPLDATG